MSVRDVAISSNLLKPAGRNPDLQQTIDLLEKLARNGYWGTVNVEFRGGRVVVLRKEETIKLNFNSIPNTGSNNDEQYRK